jgi:hypothetical protein
MPRDTQIVELLGRHQLIKELLRAELEVAVPMRDRGIDLIAYADLGDRIKNFSARPIQLKAALSAAFSVDRKYAQFPNLIIAYVWYLEDPVRTVTYALTQDEAVGVAQAAGYTKTESWNRGTYVNTRPGRQMQEMLKPFKMTPEKWWEKVVRI